MRTLTGDCKIIGNQGLLSNGFQRFSSSTLVQKSVENFWACPNYFAIGSTHVGGGVGAAGWGEVVVVGATGRSRVRRLHECSYCVVWLLVSFLPITVIFGSSLNCSGSFSTPPSSVKCVSLVVVKRKPSFTCHVQKKSVDSSLCSIPLFASVS